MVILLKELTSKKKQLPWGLELLRNLAAVDFHPLLTPGSEGKTLSDI
jgi:hypothetical protein